jgi:hypothetical protein
MLSINYIVNYLDNNQEKIDNLFYNKINNFELNDNFKINKNKDKFTEELPKSFDIIFNKNIENFYYDNKTYKNKSFIFSLLNSILVIGNKYFNLNSENEKESVIKDFLKKLDNDIFQKDLYNKYQYNKNKKFNKRDIQNVLKNSLQFKYCDKFHLLKEYISDYLGINIYIFNVKNNIIDFIESEFYLTSYYSNNINKYIPHFVILFENEVYKPLLTNDNVLYSILKYDINNEVIDNIWNYFKLNDLYSENLKKNELKEEEIKENIENEIIEKNKKYTLLFFKNMKIDEIKKLCIEEGTELLKKSDKTSKMINKLKNELIDDLLKI